MPSHCCAHRMYRHTCTCAHIHTLCVHTDTHTTIIIVNTVLSQLSVMNINFRYNYNHNDYHQLYPSHVSTILNMFANVWSFDVPTSFTKCFIIHCIHRL